ncbi:MAG: GDSL-type esterase/lipase family protein, partial [Planctomycetota bacterium]
MEKFLNLAARSMLLLILALSLYFYSFLRLRLAWETTAQDIVFHVAYGLTLIALAGGVIRAPAWLAAATAMMKRMPFMTLLFFFNVGLSVFIWFAIFTQWGVISFLFFASLVVIRFHVMNANRLLQVLAKSVRLSIFGFGLYYLVLGSGELYMRMNPERVGGGGGGNPALHEFYRGLDHFNSLGLKDDEFELEPPEGIFRIVVLGDSFAYGQGVPNEKTFPDQMEKLLNARGHDLNYETINTAKPGMNTKEELDYLNEEGWSFHPDLIVLQFYANDVSVIATATEKKTNPILQLIFRRPFERSYFIFFLRHTFDRFMYSLVRRTNEEAPPDYFWGLYRHIETNMPAWTQCRDAFTEIVRVCKERSVPIVAVLLPHPGEDHGSIPLIHEVVRNHCQAIGLPVLDLQEDVKTLPLERQIVLPFDHHPSAE